MKLHKSEVGLLLLGLFVGTMLTSLVFLSFSVSKSKVFKQDHCYKIEHSDHTLSIIKIDKVGLYSARALNFKNNEKIVIFSKFLKDGQYALEVDCDLVQEIYKK